MSNTHRLSTSNCTSNAVVVKYSLLCRKLRLHQDVSADFAFPSKQQLANHHTNYQNSYEVRSHRDDKALHSGRYGGSG